MKRATILDVKDKMLGGGAALTRLDPDWTGRWLRFQTCPDRIEEFVIHSDFRSAFLSGGAMGVAVGRPWVPTIPDLGANDWVAIRAPLEHVCRSCGHVEYSLPEPWHAMVQAE